MVYPHSGRDYFTLYFIQNIQSVASTGNPVWLYRYQLETVLHLHGLSEDSLGQALAEDLENDP